MKKRHFLPLLIGVQALISACAPGNATFDRPGLLALAEDSQKHELQLAERHVLVVRHARKVAPDCNALDCGLSDRGIAMVERLSAVVGEMPFDAAYASAACRTMLTAAAGGTDVTPHQPVDGLEQGCADGEVVSRTRADAFQDVYESDLRWTIAGEHSNTSCLWLIEFAGEETAMSAGCSEGRLPSDAYGHVYWLYQLEGVWRLAVLDGAFEVDG